MKNRRLDVENDLNVKCKGKMLTDAALIIKIQNAIEMQKTSPPSMLTILFIVAFEITFRHFFVKL